MTTKTFSFRILTPSGVTVSGDITQVQVMTYEGSIGIMAGHEPLTAACPAGIIRIEQHGAWVCFKSDEFILTVNRASATILTSTAQYAGTA
ncbi:MAG: F0F1 ATP synthase subunit epsilon [Kiritimatiellaeota bacterium]|nr:F0F1 ATP synthase subunit epsilon [Kiritimatiellota bacterium]